MNKAWWRSLGRARSSDFGALLILILFFVVFFWPTLFNGKYFVMSDSYIELYPERVVAWNMIRHGSFPFWTPLIMSGYPLLSMAQVAVGYPLTWGYLFLPGYVAEEIYTLGPYLLFSVFTYAYLREVGRSCTASLMGALAFSYGGMMISAIAYNGLLPNALMWLPLLLIAIERARTCSFTSCLLQATAAYAMSVLSGIGQGFVMGGTLALAYAIFLGIFSESLRTQEQRTSARDARRWFAWERWRPLAVTVCAMLLSMGVAAFQILETMRAQRRSIRSNLSYELLTEGSYTPTLAFKSFLMPAHYLIEVSAYISPLAFGLAVFAVVVARRRSADRDVRVFFWFGIAVLAFLLMLGLNTPLYRLIYYIPGLNLFRVPARHGFEWTFALAILAAHGWDSASVVNKHAVPGFQGRGQRFFIFLAVSLLVLGVVVGLFWCLDLARVPLIDQDLFYHYANYPEWKYLCLKALLAALTLSVAWLGWRVTAPLCHNLLLLGAIVVACFFEPSIMAARWWWPAIKTATHLTNPTAVTRFLQSYPPDQYRVYTRTNLWSEVTRAESRIDTANLTMLYGLRNVAGYEPLILKRYSRALGNTSMDAVTPRRGFPQETTLMESTSHVLDLLGTEFVAAYRNLSAEPAPFVERDGIRFGGGIANLDLPLQPGHTRSLRATRDECDTLALVSTLAFAAAVPDGATVARVRLFTVDDRVIELDLRAGVDTAEWAHERPDVSAIIRHTLAPMFDSSPGDAKNSFTAYRYWTRIPLRQHVRVTRLEISNISDTAMISIWNMTLYNSVTHNSTPLPPAYDPDKWQPVFETDDALVVRNNRALPRAWLVREAEAIDEEEALRRIRGESEHPFDPRRTALLEIAPDSLPALPGGAVSSTPNAKLIAEEPNHLVFQTQAETASILVVSEINYPGWRATIDGHIVPIYATDYLLRGIVLPAGSHRVEMRYTAPAARNGALISLFTLLVLGGIAVHHRRTSTR